MLIAGLKWTSNMSYTTATFARLDKNSDGTATMIFRYTGNTGEVPIDRGIPVNTSVMPSADWSRGIAMEHLAILNTNLSFYSGALGAVGTTLDTTTPLPAPPADVVFGAYMAATGPFTPGATPQDVFTITGSASKTIRIMRMSITTVQTSAGLNAWLLVKRSTANSGGTSSLVTAVPSDDTYPVATATVRAYTANPTAGVLIGSVWAGRIAAPTIASAPGGDSEHYYDVINRGIPPIVLTGTTDVLAWNFGGAALPAGLSVQATVWWTEGP